MMTDADDPTPPRRSEPLDPFRYWPFEDLDDVDWDALDDDELDEGRTRRRGRRHRT